MDKSRTWCPRAGCETVCTLCSTDRVTPQSVHCPTCSMDFCSNCRASWHADSPCKSEEVVPGVTFDSELIKCCPMCSVPIEKDEGCAQMLCKRCKHVFCWYCLASLDVSFIRKFGKTCSLLSATTIIHFYDMERRTLWDKHWRVFFHSVYGLN